MHARRRAPRPASARGTRHGAAPARSCRAATASSMALSVRRSTSTRPLLRPSICTVTMVKASAKPGREQVYRFALRCSSASRPLQQLRSGWAGSRGCGDRPARPRDTPPTHRVAAGEEAAVERAVADRHHPFRVGRRVVGALQRLAHVLGDRAGHQQHVGVARRGDEAQAEALEVVEGVVERVDLQLAAVAGAGIDLADRQAAAEPAARGAVDALPRARRAPRRRRAAAPRSAAPRSRLLEQQLAHVGA